MIRDRVFDCLVVDRKTMFIKIFRRIFRLSGNGDRCRVKGWGILLFEVLTFHVPLCLAKGLLRRISASLSFFAWI